MHYQEKVDEVFQQPTMSNRTLRTLFDCLSHEWEETTFEKKEEMLMKLYLSDKSLDFYIEGYKDFYKNELANKAYVVDALAKSVRMLVLNVKDELLRAALLKIYVGLSKENE